ncbi:hypothetical protein E3N88_01215 [Mikania micrantha]|uniref:Uncharacterized protein n=1 Tax=Mikania micrantha TaxID=192012 RepID=A0A5N6Q0H9_9ASTR|nr:hypothetical protein E3N88_01215 [Mikania micrantha]
MMEVLSWCFVDCRSVEVLRGAVRRWPEVWRLKEGCDAEDLNIRTTGYRVKPLRIRYSFKSIENFDSRLVSGTYDSHKIDKRHFDPHKDASSEDQDSHL